MTQKYSVDLISDLNLSNTDQFDWTGKATGLFCVVAGGISQHIEKIKEVLEHLGTCYRGVFYIDGKFEHTDLSAYTETIDAISDICDPIHNVIYMHNHVVKLNNLALVGINGWFWDDYSDLTFSDRFRVSSRQNEDLSYLGATLRNLQTHNDIHEIIVVSGSVPTETMFYNTNTLDDDTTEPAMALVMDSENKVTHWLYGGTNIISDYRSIKRRYVNNPYIDKQPYWPKSLLI